ncbi:hypothetical protein C1H57_08470 [Clostridium sp. 2-1]|uniref:hypothetical protein n=1 Tax=Clostridium TaxID=1485 RepID=UPI000CDB4E77|nr:MULTISPECIES: hypothetical protein [Clostridium]MBN7575441.1 hypothetical protein [Clostridium beijerinckii]MBN7580752.1 hypothetical protein [Clostridium beijerinckii]MBN7585205.1 hypothetical protein [Clostridium beijerinckii]MBO0521989.1 hypothetical protein [Clostridium beijerinckii]POO91841.1 hypothetical protein C1H57_08470 [Clostridium sp. 2-1]
MKRNEVEKVFQEHGLNDYRLTCIEDLKNCLGIDALAVNGYEDLTEENKEIYTNFIINFFNSMGMDKKMITVPKAINYVEEIDYVAPHPDAEVDEDYKDCYVSIDTKIIVLKADGSKKQLHKYSDSEYKNLKPTEQYRKEYLRFAFLEGKSKVWLHVTHEGKQWY